MTPGDDLFEEGAEYVLGAASTEQARNPFRFIRADLKPTGDYRFIDSLTRFCITHKPTNTKLRVQAGNSKTAFGLVGVPVCILDEPGAFDQTAGELMYAALRTAQGKPGSPLKLIIIGTLAPHGVPGNWWYELVQRGTSGSVYVQSVQGRSDRWDSWRESAELKVQETELRAAIEADDPAHTSPESREWAGLNSRFDLGEMFTNVMEHRASSGAIAEVQRERGLGANAIPIEMLMEERAVTPAPSDVGQFQTEITGFVFPQSVAAFMGIPSPVVPVGDATFPVLTSDPTAGVPAENAEQAETTGAFTADVLTPGRIQASFYWSREDAARMAGMGDALREALQGGLADKLDFEIMVGAEGLLTGIKLANHVRAAASDYGHYVAELLYGRVDGRYAYDLSDIRVVMGAATFGNAASKLPTNGEENALARIRTDSGGVRVSAHVPVVASMKQNAVVRLGNRRDMVAPVWGSVTLIPDEITLAKKGQIQLTAVMLHAIKILRVGGFYKQETNHS